MSIKIWGNYFAFRLRTPPALMILLTLPNFYSVLFLPPGIKGSFKYYVTHQCSHYNRTHIIIQVSILLLFIIS